MVNGINNSSSNIGFQLENYSQKVNEAPLPSTNNQQQPVTTNTSNPTIVKSNLPSQNLLQTSLLKQNLANSLSNNRDSLTSPTPINLKVGSKGAAVVDLQTKLKNIGFNIGTADGIFGPATDRALRAFQREHGLKVTGVFDQTTSTALDKASTFISKTGRVNSTFATDRSARELQATEILRANQVTPKEGQFYVIQIDQDSPSANAPTEQIDQWIMSYTGQTSVFKCQNGKLVEVSAQPYASASHPSMKTADTLGGTVGYQDVNKDGVADIGHMRTGVYQYTKTGERYSPVGGANLAVARDINHDGVIDTNEAKLQYTATGLQIHAGEDEHPHSAACQTLPPSDYANLQKDLSQNRNSSFTYILVRRPNDITGANPF